MLFLMTITSLAAGTEVLLDYDEKVGAALFYFYAAFGLVVLLGSY